VSFTTSGTELWASISFGQLILGKAKFSNEIILYRGLAGSFSLGFAQGWNCNCVSDILLDPDLQPGCCWIWIRTRKNLIANRHICLLKPLQRTFKLQKKPHRELYLFCGQFWPVWNLFPIPNLDPLSHLNPEPKHWSQIFFTFIYVAEATRPNSTVIAQLLVADTKCRDTSAVLFTVRRYLSFLSYFRHPATWYLLSSPTLKYQPTWQ
jgi:hypothetical protein